MKMKNMTTGRRSSSKIRILNTRPHRKKISRAQIRTHDTDTEHDFSVCRYRSPNLRFQTTAAFLLRSSSDKEIMNTSLHLHRISCKMSKSCAHCMHTTAIRISSDVELRTHEIFVFVFAVSLSYTRGVARAHLQSWTNCLFRGNHASANSQVIQRWETFEGSSC